MRSFHIVFWSALDRQIRHPIDVRRSGNYIMDDRGRAVAGPFSPHQSKAAITLIRRKEDRR